MPKLYLFKNDDKSWQENEPPFQDGGIRRGSRALLCGPPNSGKTTLCFNLIANTRPAFERIIICKMRESREYDRIEHEHLDHIRDFPDEEITPDVKVLFIIEDFGRSHTKNKDDDAMLSKLMRGTCSHFGLTIICNAQQYFEVGLDHRRRCDVFIIFPSGNDVSKIFPRLPISGKDVKNLTDDHEHRAITKHDHYYVDVSAPLDQRFRFNNEIIRFQ